MTRLIVEVHVQPGLAGVVLFALPTLFNTPGDKNTTGIPTSGPIRIAIEMLLLVVAVAGGRRSAPTPVLSTTYDC